MRETPGQSQGDASPPQRASPRPEWRIRAPFDEFRIVRGQDLQASEAGKCLPWNAVLASMHSRSSLFFRRMSHDLYEAITGVRLDLQLRPGGQQALEHWVSEAFRRGALVALSTGKVLKGGLRMSEEVQAAGTEQPLPVLAHPPPPPPALPPPSRQSTPQQEQQASGTTFIVIKIVDADGNPIPGERYKLTLSDGSTREGRVNAQGEAREENIPRSGQTMVELPDLNAESYDYSGTGA